VEQGKGARWRKEECARRPRPAASLLACAASAAEDALNTTWPANQLCHSVGNWHGRAGWRSGALNATWPANQFCHSVGNWHRRVGSSVVDDPAVCLVILSTSCCTFVLFCFWTIHMVYMLWTSCYFCVCFCSVVLTWSIIIVTFMS
jgi:hypothetical protein